MCGIKIEKKSSTSSLPLEFTATRQLEDAWRARALPCSYWTPQLGNVLPDHLEDPYFCRQMIPHQWLGIALYSLTKAFGVPPSGSDSERFFVLQQEVVTGEHRCQQNWLHSPAPTQTSHVTWSQGDSSHLTFNILVKIPASEPWEAGCLESQWKERHHATRNGGLVQEWWAVSQKNFLLTGYEEPT